MQIATHLTFTGQAAAAVDLYAAFKQHTSLYSMTDTIRRAFAKEVGVTLVKRLVKARVTELRKRANPRAAERR